MSAILIPGHVQPYVDALGVEGAYEFILQHGGAICYLSENPTEKSSVAAFLGRDKTIALARRLHVPPNNIEVPNAKPFLAAVLARDGKKVAEIARVLHCSRPTVRRMIGAKRQHKESLRPGIQQSQLSMFDDE